jgi:hypothetical protein
MIQCKTHLLWHGADVLCIDCIVADYQQQHMARGGMLLENTNEYSDKDRRTSGKEDLLESKL